MHLIVFVEFGGHVRSLKIKDVISFSESADQSILRKYIRSTNRVLHLTAKSRADSRCCVAAESSLHFSAPCCALLGAVETGRRGSKRAPRHFLEGNLRTLFDLHLGHTLSLISWSGFADVVYSYPQWRHFNDCATTLSAPHGLWHLLH